MKLRKRLYKTTALFCSLLALFSVVISSPRAVYAANDRPKAYSWYIMRNKDHTLPKCESEMSFIKELGGIYGDSVAAGSGEKVIYLTFDAGYENGNVERIVSVLEKHSATGAFFVLKNFVERNPELLCRMANDGFLICNHTLTHPDTTKISAERFETELTGLDEAVCRVTGSGCAKFFRPPEGRFDKNTLSHAKALGYKTVFWSFAYADWDNGNQPSAEYALKKILDNVHPGEIMLLHPTSKTNADILDDLLTELEAEGYRFGSLDEIK